MFKTSDMRKNNTDSTGNHCGSEWHIQGRLQTSVCPKKEKHRVCRLDLDMYKAIWEQLLCQLDVNY